MNKDLAEELLFAAQAVVYDATPNNALYEVDLDVMDTLKAVVKEISDEAEKELRAILAERKE